MHVVKYLQSEVHEEKSGAIVKSGGKIRPAAAGLTTEDGDVGSALVGVAVIPASHPSPVTPGQSGGGGTTRTTSPRQPRGLRWSDNIYSPFLGA